MRDVDAPPAEIGEAAGRKPDRWLDADDRALPLDHARLVAA